MKKEIEYYQDLMQAFDILRNQTVNLKGTYYVSGGQFLFKTDKYILSVDNDKNGFYIAKYEK